MTLTGESQNTQRKACPTATLSTSGLALDQTQTSSVRGRGLTVSAMVWCTDV